MSYILDALRQSERLRQLDGKTAPLALATMQLSLAQPPRKKTALAGFVVAALILLGVGLGIAIGWHTSRNDTATLSASQATGLRSAPPKTDASPSSSTTSTTQPLIASSPPRTAPSAHSTEPSQATQTTFPAPSRPDQPEIPDITITVHAFAPERGERLAGINGRLLREGEEVSPGLRLERITEEGVILNFKGHRFRRNVH